MSVNADILDIILILNLWKNLVYVVEVDLRITNSPNKVLISNQTYQIDEWINVCRGIIGGNTIGSNVESRNVILMNSNLLYEVDH